MLCVIFVNNPLTQSQVAGYALTATKRRTAVKARLYLSVKSLALPANLNLLIQTLTLQKVVKTIYSIL